MSTASQVYLETMLRTATPQRLRLMVIGAALRQLDRTRDDWQAGKIEQGTESLARARDCLAELLAGIRPEASELAQRVQSLYLWMIERASELGRAAIWLRSRSWPRC
jgi:flagellar protein FliS